MMTDQPRDPIQMSMPELCDHIVAQHHNFARREGPALLKSAQKLTAQNTLHFSKVKVLLDKLVCDLEPHMHKEEQVLFPLCKQLAAADTAFDMHCGSVSHPVRVMLYEHSRCRHDLHLLEDLLKTSLDAQSENQAFMDWVHRVQAFCYDLKTHIYLENELLFPMAVFRESDLKPKVAAGAAMSPEA